jgi:hypothetical protein
VKTKIQKLFIALAISAGINHVAAQGIGTIWTAQNSGSRNWSSVASSADGIKLVAVDFGYIGSRGQIYTSTDSGVTWTAQNNAPAAAWQSVASSADGTKLVAVEYYNLQIYTSADSGATWTAQNSGSRFWTSVASSADGTKLVAGVQGGQLYTSTALTGGNILKVLWPYPATEWTLQQNADLTTTNWSPSSGVSNDGTNNFITIPSPTGNLFFRLSNP